MGRLCCVPYLPAATLRCPGRKKENVQMQNKAAGRMQDLVYLNKPGSIRSFTSNVLCFDCSDFWWLTSSSDNGQNPVQEKCGSSGLTSSIAVEALLLLGTLCQHCELSWLRIYPCWLAGYQNVAPLVQEAAYLAWHFSLDLVWLCPSTGSVKPRKEELRTTGAAAVLPEYMIMNVELITLGYVCNKAWGQFWLDLRFAAHPQKMFCSPMIVWSILWSLAI